MLSDFIFQPTSWAEKKEKHGLKSKYLYLHIGITALTLFVLVWDLKLYLVVLLVTVAHFILDAVKSKLPNSSVWTFLADQFLHIIIIILVWLTFTHQFQIFCDTFSSIMLQTKIWWLFFFYILLTIPSSVLIGKMTLKWSVEIEKEAKVKNTGLKNAGKWIGIIERVLIFTFIVVNELSVIGFLLAAKSVFRFGDLKDSSEQKKTEYIIIGTFLSFALAIGVGLLYKLMIK